MTSAPSAYQRHLRLMCAHNTWAWRKLFTSLHAMPPAQYTQPCGLFAGCIRGTVQHILFADYLWYARHTGAARVGGVQIDSLVPLWSSTAPHVDWARAGDTCSPPIASLATAETHILEQCDRWHVLLNSLSDAQVDTEFSYQSTTGEHMKKHRGTTLAHVFHHSTHHRGQVSAAVTQFGHPAPEMDLTYYLDAIKR